MPVVPSMTKDEFSIIDCHELKEKMLLAFLPRVLDYFAVRLITFQKTFSILLSLHNFLLNDNGYHTSGLVDTDARPGEWREEIRGCKGLIDLPRVGAN